MEKTNKWDGGGCGEKRRRHDDELEAVAAELAWRPAVAAAAASSLLVLLVGIILLWRWDCLNLLKKSNPHIGMGTPQIGLGRD
jgi:hypothetical protein